MTEPPLIARQRTLLHDLFRLAAERARDERALADGLESRLRQEGDGHGRAVARLGSRLAADRAAAEAADEEARRGVQDRYESERTAALIAARRGWAEFKPQLAAERAAARSAYQEARWAANAIHEGCKAESDQHRREQEGKVAEKRDRMQQLRKEMLGLLRAWRQPEELLAAPPPADRPARKLPQCVAEAERLAGDLRERVPPRELQRRRMLIGFGLLAPALVFPLGWLAVALGGLPMSLGTVIGSGAVAGTVTAAVLGIGTHLVLGHLARERVRETALPLGQTLAEGEARAREVVARLAAQGDRQVNASRRHHDAAARRALAAFRQRRAEWTRRRDETRTALKARLRESRRAAARCRARDLRRADCRNARRLETLRRAEEAETRLLREGHETRLAAIHAAHEAAWDAMARRWRDGLAGVRAAVAWVRAESADRFPSWGDPAPPGTRPGAAPPDVLRFGEYRVNRGGVPHAVPTDERLRVDAPDDFALPALTPFAARASVLLHARGEGCAKAVTVLQALVFRLLTTLPPGKVRFTFLDPVGMGHNFAGFMHLGDHDDAVVGGRIWTETGQIEARLAELSAHLETVIQKCLRDRYPTLADYNAQAGEVAEPYRVVVAANFPVHFSDEAARRLVRIARTGARSGVYVLLTRDEERPAPHEFPLAELEQACVNLHWKGDAFHWDDTDFGQFPLDCDTPPAGEPALELLDRIGRAARQARRVEVPFEFIAPPEAEWWTADSRHGLEVALGRAGARDRQYLRLGQGTAQHVLVAGKTGSGKSTLLHALVTNAALCYGPSELEFYLIDFKKGVEFQTYAVHRLPHARVVAVESEREFGLSVLQRLDAELQRRGERFRAAGAQDLAAYRAGEPDAHAPRILLVVDEFQEFFVEDDRIAHAAAQLLDRLVRQGRAFGLHVLLGSQTLGGAYSLARSTIDQMAVRVALQCSEADSQLILSADNSAARLLARPGEAIYNDANGVAGGNHPFQVVWLPEDRREGYLERLRVLARERSVPELPLAVFEGNSPADVTRNEPLAVLLRSAAPGGDGAPWPAEPRAWLGESLALGEPTAASFRRQNGSNLLVVGSQEEAALGVLAAAALGLGVQASSHDPASPPLTLIDGTQASPPERGLLARLPELLPCRVRLGGWRQLPAVLMEMAAEVERRQASDAAEALPLFFVLYGLQRCRDLRRPEDDFGFGRRDESGPTPPQLLATLLRDGPAVGVHLLLWCDTLSNLQRSLDRQALRELSLRVVFQMNVADSSSLIDSPLASKLGPHRALFLNEEDGRLERFRPYAPPPEEWLEWVKAQVAARAGTVGSAP